MDKSNHKKGSKTIYGSENSLLEDLSETYSKEDRGSLVFDGLCWGAISNKYPDTNNNNWPECLWTYSERRVLFLLKEPNGNPGEDYKDWVWSTGRENFGNILAYWLEGILRTTSDYLPDYDELSSREEIFKKYPLAIVNLKKLAGGNAADWNAVWKYAERDKAALRTQIREILNPNIIVCGGSNDDNDDFRKVITIALDVIFPDIKDGFRKINNWCYYNSEADILLIDSYHPASRMGSRYKVEELVKNFHDFILTTKYQH